MNENQLLLIDLSALAHMIWHVSGNEPDPSFVSNQLVVKVRQLASQHPYAAICCDNGKSFRTEIDPQYKAQRDTENRAPLHHQMTLACETLKADGFPIWSVKGYEADDLIASATREALAIDGTTVQIVSSDKDLTQLISDRVTMQKLDGTLVDVAGVREKFKVGPSQMGDFLALVGDKSDNIIGADGIGAVKAAALLNEHGTLANLYEKMAKGVVQGVTPAMRTSLMVFKDRWPVVAQLIALKSDVPIPFAEIAVERTAKPMDAEDDMTGFIEEDTPQTLGTSTAKETQTVAKPEPNGTASKGGASTPTPEVLGPVGQPALIQPDTGAAPGKPAAPAGGELVPVSPVAPVEFSQQLEPRDMNDAIRLAQRMYDSRLFGAYGTPQAVLATVLAGRELGMPAMASLRAFHVIEGKPTLSAGAIQALVLKSGKAKYFRCTERTNEKATFETQRGDDPPIALTFTIADAQRAWTRGADKFQQSGWGKNPADLCVARASSKLARLVYPDVVSGLYAPEEFD